MINILRIFLVFCLGTNIVSAQTKDAQLWNKISVSKAFSQKINSQFDFSTRLGNNISELNTYYFQLSTDFKLKKGLKMGVLIRYAEKYDFEDIDHVKYRIGLYTLFKKKILKTLVFQYRAMFQNQYTDYKTSDKGSLPNYYFRNKCVLELDLNTDYSPYISYESYFNHNYKFNDFSKNRYQCGIKYTINKLHALDLYYLIQNEINVSSPTKSYVIGLNYKLSI